MRLWGRIYEDLSDFGRGFMSICETLGGVRISEDSQDFGRGFVRIWERICNTLGEDSCEFWKRLCEDS